MEKKEKIRTVLSFDYAMKRLLRQKSNFRILEGFLSELLGRDIVINRILESESNQETFDDKQTRVDILAEETKGELMLIEVQYQFEIDYLLRMLYGASKNVIDYLSRGDAYKEIKKVYSISILYFNKFNRGKEYIYHGKNEFRGLHTDEILQLTDSQKKVFEKETAGDLFPEYYLLDVTNFDDVAKSTLDEWIYYLKNSEIKENFSAKGMKEVKSHLDYEKMSKEERRRYEKMLDIQRGWKSSIDTAKIEGRAEGLQEGIEKGLQEGIEKGLQEGIEKGMKKGEAKGRAEGLQEGIEKVAISMYKLKIPPAQITEATGLTEKQILKIVK